MLQILVQYMVNKLTDANLFGKVHGLVSLITIGDKTFPALYKGTGRNTTAQLDPAKWFGVAYFRKNGAVSFTQGGIEQFKPCAVPVQITIPMKLICTIKKDALKCDDVFASDELAMYIGKLLSDINGIRTEVKAKRVTFNVNEYITDPREIVSEELIGLENTIKSEYAYLSMSIEVQVDTTKDCMFDYCGGVLIDEVADQVVDQNNNNIKA